MNRENRMDGFPFYAELEAVFEKQFLLSDSGRNRDRYVKNLTVSDDLFEIRKKQMDFYSLGWSRMTGRNKLIVNN